MASVVLDNIASEDLSKNLNPRPRSRLTKYTYVVIQRAAVSAPSASKPYSQQIGHLADAADSS